MPLPQECTLITPMGVPHTPKKWVVPEKIHTRPTEEIPAIWRGEKFVSDHSKCIWTLKGALGLTADFLRGEVWMFSAGAKLALFNSGGVCQNCPAKTDDALQQIFISGHYFYIHG